jgi:predicted nucleic acid-binding Zn ribbon protein
MKLCPKCGVEHEKEGKFCSRTCANSRVWTEEKKKALTKKMAGLGKKTHITKHCLICGVSFETKSSSSKKSCSSECSFKLLSNTLKGTSGGERKGSGRSKSGWYRNIYCGSTYELAWVIYRLEHDLPVKRFDGYLTDGTIKYYPDFIEESTIYEIKGFYTDLVDKKTSIAKSHGYEVILLYKKDLDHIFDWLEQKTSLKPNRFHELYEDYVPQYRTCNLCEKTFEKKPRTKGIFCSKSCAMKRNRTNRVKKDS